MSSRPSTCQRDLEHPRVAARAARVERREVELTRVGVDRHRPKLVDRNGIRLTRQPGGRVTAAQRKALRRLLGPAVRPPCPTLPRATHSSGRGSPAARHQRLNRGRIPADIVYGARKMEAR